MIQQTIFPFKLKMTKEELTAYGGLALMAEFNHGIVLRELTDNYLPGPQSNRGYVPSVFVDTMILMLEGGGRSLEDIRELAYESPLMRIIGREDVPGADAIGDWLRRMGDKERNWSAPYGLDKNPIKK